MNHKDYKFLCLLVGIIFKNFKKVLGAEEIYDWKKRPWFEWDRTKKKIHKIRRPDTKVRQGHNVILLVRGIIIVLIVIVLYDIVETKLMGSVSKRPASNGSSFAFHVWTTQHHGRLGNKIKRPKPLINIPN